MVAPKLFSYFVLWGRRSRRKRKWVFVIQGFRYVLKMELKRKLIITRFWCDFSSNPSRKKKSNEKRKYSSMVKEAVGWVEGEQMGYLPVDERKYRVKEWKRKAFWINQSVMRLPDTYYSCFLLNDCLLNKNLETSSMLFFFFPLCKGKGTRGHVRLIKEAVFLF